jgi:hypothetical protein
MGYIHVEIDTVQTSKKPGKPCGDVVIHERTASATTLIVCDGLGSGIKANIAATMCASHLMELFRSGFSLRKGFANMAKMMNEARGTDLPYSVFTVARILNDGTATILSYEMPGPILISQRHAVVLQQRMITMEHAMIGESNCLVEPGEGILIVSDGISQAGLGTSMRNGWEVEGACRHINTTLADGILAREVPRYVLRRALELWGENHGDDCTVALASCRWGKTVNILTGPPSRPDKDRDVVAQFLMGEGSKIVCGGTTANIVADYRGTKVEVEPNPQSTLAPPSYSIDGIHLVTEGAVTLNQVYNILDEDADDFEEESGVTKLCQLLKNADRINFMVGVAQNPASSDIAFRQRGILKRTQIIPLIADKLRHAGKLVVIDYI